jgi:L-asparagine transporter-like permease
MSHRQKFMFGMAFVPAIALMTIGSVTRAVLNGDLVNNTWNILATLFLAISALPIVHLCSGFRVSENHPHLRRYATAEFWGDAFLYLPLLALVFLMVAAKAIETMEETKFCIYLLIFICSVLAMSFLCYKGKHPRSNELVVPLNEAEQAECGLRGIYIEPCCF